MKEQREEVWENVFKLIKIDGHSKLILCRSFANIINNNRLCMAEITEQTKGGKYEGIY